MSGTRLKGESEKAIDFLFVSLCSKPSQPQRITSELKKTFIKRYVVERTSKEEQGEKTESCQGNIWNEIQLKGP